MPHGGESCRGGLHLLQTGSMDTTQDGLARHSTARHRKVLLTVAACARKKTKMVVFDRLRLAVSGKWGAQLSGYNIVSDPTHWVVTCGRNDRILANGISTATGMSGGGNIGNLHVRGGGGRKRVCGGMCMREC